jgi:multimeric flavodoxin WrbA
VVPSDEPRVSEGAVRVLCIAGSPRRHGNSERLLDALIEGVERAGGEARKLVVRDEGIGACMGCGGCRSDGHCVRGDGMSAIYAELDAAHAIVVSTPVYFATVPAILKCLLERCQPYWVRRYVLKEPRPSHKRPGAILVVGGGGDPFGTSCATAPVKSAFAVLSVSADHIMEVVGPDESGEIAQRADVLGDARMLGETLVREAAEDLDL